MKIYVVIQSLDYEGDYVKYVTKYKEEAYTLSKRLNDEANQRYVSYRVNEYEV